MSYIQLTTASGESEPPQRPFHDALLGRVHHSTIIIDNSLWHVLYYRRLNLNDKTKISLKNDITK